MSKRAKILIATVVVAVLGIVAFAGSALAADPNAGTAPSAGTPGWGVCGNGYGFGPVWSEDVTKLLGLTAEQIQAQRQDGKSLAEIAASKGVTQDALVTAILAPRKALIQTRVQSGYLTQAQADQMLKQMEQNIRQSITRTTIGPPADRGAGGCGGGFGGKRWGEQNAPATGTPQAGPGPGMMRGFGRGIR